MNLTPFRWLVKHLGTLLVAFFLAVVVWVSAVVTADPNEERTFTRQINLIGQDSNLALVGNLPAQVRISVNAPRSILTSLTNNPNLLQVWVDMGGLKAGEHTLPIQVSWNVNPVRLIQKEPEEVQFVLESLETRILPIQLVIEGEPPLGYQKDAPSVVPTEVTLFGRQSLLNKVTTVRAYVNIAGAAQTIQSNVTLQVLDRDGSPVNEVSITPRSALVTQPISLLGGYKNVVVKVVTTGKIANGYRLTNISVTPLNVTVFSDRPELINALPGFVETRALDLTDLQEDIEVRLELDLPPEVTLVGEQSVLVQVSVASIEGSLRVTLPVETLGVLPGYAARLSPSQVDVLISGPLPILDTLTSASFRAVVDLTGLGPGVYQVKPVIDLAPEKIIIDAVLPESISVVLEVLPTPTPTSVPTPTPLGFSPLVPTETPIP